jgi:hypothetical protein
MGTSPSPPVPSPFLQRQLAFYSPQLGFVEPLIGFFHGGLGLGQQAQPLIALPGVSVRLRE